MVGHGLGFSGGARERPASLEAMTARALLERLFREHLTLGFAVRLWDGSEVAWGERQDFTVVFRDRATFASLVASRDASEFARAYVEERVDLEGDVDAAVGLASCLRAAHPRPIVRLVRPLRRAVAHLRSHVDDARDVRAHYDLSDEFFRLFLDRRMVYSCAYFAHPGQSLEEAQERKLDLVCKKLQLRPGERFLDVGCGWGALAIWAAQHYGVRAHGITLSENQAAEARARAAGAGLSARVTISRQHYRDLPEAAFDKIASVGMIEHVGLARHGAYFESIARALRPGGLLLNHGITLPPSSPERAGGTFMLGTVFPGAEIVGLVETLAALERRGFEVLDVQSLRPHYALTLREWCRRFVARRDEAARIVAEPVLRAWELYLPGCRHAFADHLVSVHQCLAAKTATDGAWPSALTREEMMLG